MLVKACIKVYGNVQGVGYRVLVENIAMMFGVRGLVRNLEDRSVEIFAEAMEDTLEKFLEAIDVKGRPGDVLSLNVEKIDIVKEGEAGYTGPWRPYTQFEIDYGEEDIRPLERDIVESLEWAKLYFIKLVSEFTDFREEFRDYRGEFRGFREEFRGFKDESLKISGEILNELKTFKDESLKMDNHILGEVRELRRDLKTVLDERPARMEKDIAETKAKLVLL